jgi:hypothetical protein
MHGCIRLSAVHPMAIVPPICFTTIAAIVIPILDNDDDKDIPVRGIINTPLQEKCYHTPSSVQVDKSRRARSISLRVVHNKLHFIIHIDERAEKYQGKCQRGF